MYDKCPRAVFGGLGWCKTYVKITVLYHPVLSKSILCALQLTLECRH